MKKNFKYRFGGFLFYFQKYLPKIYFFLASPKSLIGIVYQSFIKYYLDNRQNIVKEVKFRPKKAKEVITPEITKQ